MRINWKKFLITTIMTTILFAGLALFDIVGYDTIIWATIFNGILSMEGVDKRVNKWYKGYVMSKHGFLSPTWRIILLFFILISLFIISL